MRLTIEPRSRSAPRASCDLTMRSVSLSSVGMQRSAIVIIIASSCAGKPKRLNGEKMLSSPSDSAIGLVVSVSRLANSTSSVSRSAIVQASSTPSRLTRKILHCHNGSPDAKNRFSSAVKTIRNSTVRIERSKKDTLVRASAAQSHSTAAQRIQS